MPVIRTARPLTRAGGQVGACVFVYVCVCVWGGGGGGVHTGAAPPPGRGGARAGRRPPPPPATNAGSDTQGECSHVICVTTRFTQMTRPQKRKTTRTNSQTNQVNEKTIQMRKRGTHLGDTWGECVHNSPHESTELRANRVVCAQRFVKISRWHSVPVEQRGCAVCEGG
jgi:hypothetical protein